MSTYSLLARGVGRLTPRVPTLLNSSTLASVTALLLLVACGSSSGTAGPGDNMSGSSSTESAGSDTNGDGSSDGDSTGSNPQVDQDAVRAAAETMCHLFERCELPQRYIYGTGDACLDVMVPGYQAMLLLLDEELWPFEAIANCDALKTAPCPDPGLAVAARWTERTLASCTTATAASEGDACNQGGCQAGLRCDSESETSCGACVAAPQDWCELDSHCSEDERCDEENNACVALVHLGSPCERSVDCESGECADGMCTILSVAGEACEIGNDCVSFLDCIEGKCQGPAGEGDDCSVRECRLSLVCTNDTCERIAPATLKEGETCNPVGYACEAGTFCDFEEGICMSDDIGEPCSLTCGLEHTCIDGSCAPLFENGQACGSSYDCESHRCFEGACAPRLSCFE